MNTIESVLKSIQNKFPGVVVTIRSFDKNKTGKVIALEFDYLMQKKETPERVAEVLFAITGIIKSFLSEQDSAPTICFRKVSPATEGQSDSFPA